MSPTVNNDGADITVSSFSVFLILLFPSPSDQRQTLQTTIEEQRSQSIYGRVGIAGTAAK